MDLIGSIFSNENFHVCEQCGLPRVWYKFRYPLEVGKPKICFSCKSQRSQLDESLHLQLQKIYVEKRIQKLINQAMANKMSDLREHLFDALQKVKNDEMKIDKAKSVCEIAQTIINSVKVEVEAIKALGGAKKSVFLELEGVSD